MFIAIEGPDCSFKTTVIEQLRKDLVEELEGFCVYSSKAIRYDDESSYYVKKFLNNGYTKINPFTQAMMYLLQIYDTQYNECNRFAYENDNVIVLSDRWTLSTILYSLALAFQDVQIEGDERRFISKVRYIMNNMVPIIRPTVTVILDQYPSIRQELLSRKQNKDTFEKNNTIQDKVYEYYKNLDYYDEDSILTREQIKYFCGKLLRVAVFSHINDIRLPKWLETYPDSIVVPTKSEKINIVSLDAKIISRNIIRLLKDNEIIKGGN